MREQLRQEVLRRFAGAPDTQQARDLRDEILSNTLQRYDDLLAEGRSEQEAYASALESIGDVEELLSALPQGIRAVVRLKGVEGLNSTEIAEALQIPAATVRTRLRAARLYLKKRRENE